MSGIEWPVDIPDADGIEVRLRVHANHLVINMSGAFRMFDRKGVATLRAALEAAEQEMS